MNEFKRVIEKYKSGKELRLYLEKYHDVIIDGDSDRRSIELGIIADLYCQIRILNQRLGELNNLVMTGRRDGE